MVAQGPGSIQQIAPAKQQPQRQETPQRALSRPTTAAAPSGNPADVEAASKRLDALLERDAGAGPRQDVPRRGFYLNILV